jgi:hypothetical protein
MLQNFGAVMRPLNVTLLAKFFAWNFIYRIFLNLFLKVPPNQLHPRTTLIARTWRSTVIDDLNYLIYIWVLIAQTISKRTCIVYSKAYGLYFFKSFHPKIFKFWILSEDHLHICDISIIYPLLCPCNFVFFLCLPILCHWLWNLFLYNK